MSTVNLVSNVFDVTFNDSEICCYDVAVKNSTGERIGHNEEDKEALWEVIRLTFDAEDNIRRFAFDGENTVFSSLQLVKRGSRQVSLEEHSRQNLYVVSWRHSSNLSLTNATSNVETVLDLIERNLECFASWSNSVFCKTAFGNFKFIIDTSTMHSLQCDMPNSARRKLKFLRERLHDSYNLASLGVSIARSPSCTMARILHVPILQFGNDEKINPIMIQWGRDVKPLYKPKDISYWAIFNMAHRCEMNDLARDLQRCGAKIGLTIGYAAEFFDEYDAMFEGQYSNFSESTKVEKLLDFLDYLPSIPEFLIFLPPSDSSKINDLFQKKCMALGIVTHSIDAYARSRKSYLMKELLKINLKVGGINFIINSVDERNEAFAMIFGVSSLISENKQRCVSTVVGAITGPSMRYRASVRIHQPTDNADIHEMIRELLKNLQNKKERTVPKRVLIFRSEASESQGTIELEEIRQAFESFYERNDLEFTFILVQEDSIIRFFRYDNQYAFRGLVVAHDKFATSSFYICENSINDELKTTRYTILANEVEREENLEGYINKLCYMYEGSIEPTSLVAPIRYAQMASSKILKFCDLDDTTMHIHTKVADSFFL